VNKYEMEVLEIEGEKIETWRFKINTDNKGSVKLLKEIVDYINGTNIKLVIDPIDEIFAHIYLYPQELPLMQIILIYYKQHQLDY